MLLESPGQNKLIGWRRLTGLQDSVAECGAYDTLYAGP
jgi:hypothetical protein